jgi:hypothetical protein
MGIIKAIFAPNNELCPKLVAIGHNQPFSTAKVLSSDQEDNEPKVLCSDQEDNELLVTLRESFNLPINLGFRPSLTRPCPSPLFLYGS